MRFGTVLFILFSESMMAQFSGPAILSRGEAPAAMNASNAPFRPYAEARGVYDGGLEGVSLSSTGQLQTLGSAGVQLNWGLSGSRSSRHTTIGIDYRGSMTRYERSTFNNNNQAVLLGVTHQFSPHVRVLLREAAGTFSRNFRIPGLSQTVPFDPVASYIPTVDYFDNRTSYATTQADLTVQRSRRLAFNIGGDGFITRRRATQLEDVKGASARGDVEYRLTARTSVGGNYTYTHYTFSKTIADTDQHAFAGSYSTRFTRTLEFSGYAGVARSESKFERTSPVDPVIAALLGIVSTRELVHTIRWAPNVAARLSKRYAKGVLYLSGGHTITPGNGLFMTSFSTMVNGGYTYTGLRRWAFTASAAHNNSEAVGLFPGHYRTTTGTLSLSRQVTRSLHFVSEAGGRQYGSPDYSGYNRTTFFARVGFGFTPGDLPFRLW